MKISITVRGKAYESRPWDLIRWERLRGKPISVLGETMSVEDIYVLAYVRVDPPETFDAWVRELDADDVQLGDVESGNPTRPAA